MMTSDKHCNECEIYRRCNESAEPSCCQWYLEHAVVGGEDTSHCPVFKPMRHAPAPEPIPSKSGISAAAWSL